MAAHTTGSDRSRQRHDGNSTGSPAGSMDAAPDGTTAKEGPAVEIPASFPSSTTARRTAVARGSADGGTVL